MQHLHHAHQQLHKKHEIPVAPLELEKRDPAIKTVVSYVYVTASKTFEGPIGGYRTLDENGNPVGETPPPKVAKGSPIAHVRPHDHDRHDRHDRLDRGRGGHHHHDPKPAPSRDPKFAHHQVYSSTPVSTPANSVDKPKHKPQKTAAVSSSPVESPIEKTPAFSTPAALGSSHTPSAKSTSNDSGMSSGAKAGLAIGIIAIIALVAGLIFFFYRKKKNQSDSHQRLDDEKSHNAQTSLTSHVSVRKSKTEAPRLSLRPMTQMFPPNGTEKQPTAPTTGFLVNSAGNAQPKQPEPVARASPKETSNPFDDTQSTDLAAAAAAPKPLSVKSQGSANGLGDTSGSSSGRNSPAPPNGAARAAPPSGASNNVHRVQLDFKPSMDDELELRAGQVVRLLHEYDDGWALCVRLDRSQQGVAPRSCLSKLPLKPRPQGPPPPGMRAPPQGRPRGPPPTGQGRRISPTESLESVSSSGSDRPRANAPPGPRVRAQSNAGHPGQQRPRSPSQAGGPPRPRANTSGGSPNESRRITPPSPLIPSSTSPPQANVPSRKPVPGQAM